MSLALVEAAREAGIGLTLLPVLYMSGGFDGRPLSERQRRFGHDVDGFMALVERLRALEHPLLRVGIALHSLRAVPAPAMRAVLDAVAGTDLPIHIHIAEQIGEVQDCLAVRDARPVEWLFDHAAVDARWCLVHATHMTADEMRRLAACGAVAGLCPSTEANLGDGLFPLAAYLDAGGALGIGSDSHISVSPVEELRWLEYGQRLATRHRNVAARRAGASVGATLWTAALTGGTQASGLPPGALATGQRADLLVLDDASPLLAARDAASILDSFLFAGNTPLVRDVMVAGRWIVRDFRHHDEARIAQRYRASAERLTTELVR
jgi:formimidoylglutamate deiminase